MAAIWVSGPGAAWHCVGQTGRGTRCHYCGTAMVAAARQKPQSATWQHIIPQRRGGSDGPENLRGCCASCNIALSVADDCPLMLACAVDQHARLPNPRNLPATIRWMRAYAEALPEAWASQPKEATANA